MIVEVVLREVGEQRDLNVRAVQAVFRYAVRRRLQRASRKAVIGKALEGALQSDGVGRGQAGEFNPRRSVVCLLRCRRLAHTQGADHAAALTQGGERLRKPPCTRCFAVGASDGQHFQALAGVAKKRAAQMAGGGFEIGNGGDFQRVKFKRVGTIGLDQTSRSARRQRIGHMRSRIVCIAGPGDEGVAGVNRAAVGGQACGAARLQPAQRGGGVGQSGEVCGGHGFGQSHQKLSTSAGSFWVTICWRTSRSGCTPKVRRVCCTTSLNTGAATSPP